MTGFITPRKYSGLCRGRPRYSSDRRGRASGMMLAIVLASLVALAIAGGLGGPL